MAYTFALSADPELTPALDASRRLRAFASDWSAVAALAERSARASLDRENVAAAWVEAAEVHESRTGDPARALASYRALLATQPAHAHALERALILFEASSDFAGAASVLLAHADAIGHDPAAQARALTRRATILASRIGDTAGAIVDLRRAMALTHDADALPSEDDVKTIQALAILEERVKNWPEALQLYERIAQMKSSAADRAGPSTTTRRRARLAQARIYGDELRDDVKGKEILEELVASRPDDRDASFRLAEISARSGHEARALELYEALSTGGSAVERVRALVALSDLQRSRPDAASKTEGEAALARAFDLAIADPTMLTPLEDRVVRDGDHRSFVAHAEAAVEPRPAEHARRAPDAYGGGAHPSRRARQPRSRGSAARRRDPGVPRVDGDPPLARDRAHRPQRRRRSSPSSGARSTPTRSRLGPSKPSSRLPGRQGAARLR